jgi:Glycosyl transferase family 2
MSAPKISVIVHADSRPGHSRDQFLLDAVRSVVAQSLERDAFEVIVTKNFRSPVIEKELTSLGVIDLFDDDPILGRRRTRSIRAAKCNVVVFLSDDDKLEPGFLARVQDVFNQHPNLGYYKCRHHLIDESGRFRRPHWTLARSVVRQGATLIESSQTDYEERCVEVALHGREHVESGCAMRKEAIDQDLLQNSSAALDHVLWASAAFASFGMFFDELDLLQYRVHPHSHTSDLSRDELRLSTVARLRDVARIKGLSKLASMEEFHLVERRLLDTHARETSRAETIRFGLAFVSATLMMTRSGIRISRRLVSILFLGLAVTAVHTLFPHFPFRLNPRI